MCVHVHVVGEVEEWQPLSLVHQGIRLYAFHIHVKKNVRGISKTGCD